MNTGETATLELESAAPIASPKIDSVALQRLIDEVRNNEPTVSSAYNRMHNRHNR